MKNLVLQGERHDVLLLRQEDTTVVASAAAAAAASNNNVDDVVSVINLTTSSNVSTATSSSSSSSNNSSDTLVLLRNGIVMRLNNNIIEAHQQQQQQYSNSVVAWRTNLNHVVDDDNDANEQQQQEDIQDDEWFSMTLLPNDDGGCDGGEMNDSEQHEQQQQQVVVCFSKRRGAIVTVSTTTGRSNLVGELEYGLTSASCLPAFSPNLDMVLLVTRMPQKTVLIAMTTTTTTTTDMSAQFEVLGEVTLVEHNNDDNDDMNMDDNNDDSNKNAVSICWKPDGSLFAVSCCIPASPATGTNATRGGSDKTTTQQQHQHQHQQQQQQQLQRVVRIYNRHDLQQQAIGRIEDGSGRLLKNLSAHANMAWAGPACSQLLAVATTSSTTSSTTRLPAYSKGSSNKSSSNASGNVVSSVPAGQVYFLEPNGLQHGQLTLRHDPQDVIDVAASSSSLPVVKIVGLAWNCTFDVLAVTIQCTYTTNNTSRSNSSMDTTTTKIVDKVQLWHRCNYHWYLKYELRFTNGERIVMLQNSAVAAVTFHEEKPYVLRVLLTTTNNNNNNIGTSSSSGSSSSSSSCWRSYTWSWHSASPAQTAFVVDGSQLLVTPLSRAMVPPPMAACTISLPCPIVSVSTILQENDSDNDNKIVLVHLSNGKLVLLSTAATTAADAATDAATCYIPGYSPPTIMAETKLADWCCITNDNNNKDTVSVTAAAISSPRRLFLRQFAIVGNVHHDNDTHNETTIHSSVRLVAVAAADPMSTTTTPTTECLVEMLLTWNTSTATTTTTTAPTNNNAIVEILNQLPLEAPVLALVNWSDSVHNALIELDDGTLLEYQLDTQNGNNNNMNNSEICNSRRHCITGSIVPSLADPLLEPCPWIAGLENPSSFLINDSDHGDNDHHHHRKRLVIGQSSRSRLYCHDLLLADTVSSFHLSTGHHFLCYATAGSSRCQVRFLSLLELYEFDPLVGSDENKMTLHGYEPRNVERGSRIVTVLSTGQARVVLQMPRGNIEGIYPRALVLRQAMLQIASRKYRQAFELMRRQKVDLNLLVDMDPWFFVQANSNDSDGATCFVKQIKNIDHLNLFISCLQNFDSTLARYPVPRWLVVDVKKATGRRHDNETSRQFDFSNKVNQVCQRLRSIFTCAEQSGTATNGHYLLPILSTFAKEEPPKLEDALKLIKENALARAPATVSSKKPPLFSDHAQSSIQYLAFLADYELLFETALGMYDFDIARAVARNSQMDPKEYLPLLKRYRSLPLYYGRYEVDLRLNRYESALKNLFASNSCEECIGPEAGVPLGMDKMNMNILPGNRIENCMTLIEQKKLHRLGLELFHANDDARRRIMIDLGDVLLKDKKAENALSIYLNASPVDEERVKKAARECMDWRTFFAFSFKQNSQEHLAPDIVSSKRLLLAREVAEELVASAEGTFNKREVLSEAARILLDYGNDVTEAIDILIKAELWGEAKRIGHLHERPELVRRSVDAAISYAQTAIEDMEERATTFITTNDRYVEVLRIRKEAYALGEVDAVDVQEDDNGSLFSATSNSSALSAMSRASAGSTGSSSSISTVISVKSKSSFSLTGIDDTARHKSKFNQIGRNKKKTKKKKKGGRTKVIPGSEQELQGLVETLRSLPVDSQYSEAIGRTINFLVQVGEMSLARALYDSFVYVSDKIQQTQEKRRELAAEEKIVKEQIARREGLAQHQTDHPSECVVGALACCVLPDRLHELFQCLPPL